MKRVLGYLLTIILLVVLAAAGYCVYVGASYSRIDDGTAIIVQNNFSEKAERGAQYTAVTLNIGYAANDRAFSSWEDGGKSVAVPLKETVTENLYDLSDALRELDAQLILLQEVDRDSARSRDIDMPGKLGEEFPDKAYIYTSTYHTPYLLYPFSDPLKRVNSGLMTLSSFGMSAALRRSLPVSEGLEKYYSPDSGYSVFRAELDGGELFIYNVKITRIDFNETLARAQLQLLFEDMKAKAKKGNYVVCGGDFGCSLDGDGALKPLPKDLLPKGFTVCAGGGAPSARDAKAAYVEGETPTYTCDGFIISGNVECVKLTVVDLGFRNSDHNPVRLDFKLK